jgi:hypothetical protein
MSKRRKKIPRMLAAERRIAEEMGPFVEHVSAVKLAPRISKREYKDMAIRRIESELEEKSLHGPVRIIMRDFKLVGPPQ